MHIETGRVITGAEMAALRTDNAAAAEEYAPLPRRLSRAAKRLLDRGDRYPTEKDPDLLAHHGKLLAKLRKKRQRLEKAGRKAARKGK